MKFSEQIKKNYGASSVKNWIAIILCALFDLSILSILFSAGMPTITSISDVLLNLFVIAIFLVMLGIPAIIIRSSIRKIKTGSLDKFMKTLEPFGNPKEMIAHVDRLPVRSIGKFDFRFDDTYFAYAHKREIYIRRMDQIRVCFDYGIESNLGRRCVQIILNNGENIAFIVGHSEIAESVLQEFYGKSAFGKRIQNGEMSGDCKPFVHENPQKKEYQLSCDGTQFVCYDSHKQRHQIQVKDLQSFYIYSIPDAEAADDYFVILYLTDGSTVEIPTAHAGSGFNLYLRFLSCAPQLKYKFPN